MIFARDVPQEWIRQFIDSTADPITVVSTDGGRLVDVNSAFAMRSGLKGSEVIGKTPFEAGFLTDRNSYERLLRNPNVSGLEQMEFRTRTGEAWTVKPAVMAATVAAQQCLIITWRDVTRQKEIERELARARDLAIQSSQLKSHFLANISHELRTPLSAIIGMTQLLQDTSLTTEQRDYANTIGASSMALLKILNDVLDFSKASGRKLHLEPRVFELRPMIEYTLASFQGQASSKGLRINAHFDPALPARVRGDGTRLGQVLSNLVSNAVKFTDRGEVNITAALKEASDQSLLLRVQVKDSGVGISPENQVRLFQPFVQINGSSTRRYGGTGLGLAICAQLVELMGGEIGLSSILGQGSTFYFTARLDRTEDPADGRIRGQSPPQSLTPTVGARPADQTRVLVVDDNSVSRLLIHRELEALGFRRIEVTVDGAQALDKLSRMEFDVVLMDCQMPEMDGCKATELLRSIEQGKRHTVVIALTANDTTSDRENCLAAGMDDFISKPLLPHELERALARTGLLLKRSATQLTSVDDQ